jgi:hypothetical protein
VVHAGGERLDVRRLDRREHRDPQLVAAELAIGLHVDDAVLTQHLRDLAASTLSSKSIVPTTSERCSGSATNGVV